MTDIHDLVTRARAKITERISAAGSAHGMSYNWKAELQDAYKALKAELEHHWKMLQGNRRNFPDNKDEQYYSEACIRRIANALGVE